MAIGGLGVTWGWVSTASGPALQVELTRAAVGIFVAIVVFTLKGLLGELGKLAGAVGVVDGVVGGRA